MMCSCQRGIPPPPSSTGGGAMQCPDPFGPALQFAPGWHLQTFVQSGPNQSSLRHLTQLPLPFTPALHTPLVAGHLQGRHCGWYVCALHLQAPPLYGPSKQYPARRPWLL
eukprot:TRINITY_DN17712_c0_g2_i3.p6 TRINITY_DN17712_c0_g2~~TRINITY_DN17712_c0_g2_i3.p6  ORF type:complete len:110 (-),score=9.39 TRINITY_DN17712_c0_g2_i3:853-1182(-)